MRGKFNVGRSIKNKPKKVRKCEKVGYLELNAGVSYSLICESVPKGKHISCNNIYEKYSIKGAKRKSGNFISYVNRTQNILSQKNLLIERQQDICLK